MDFLVEFFKKRVKKSLYSNPFLNYFSELICGWIGSFLLFRTEEVKIADMDVSHSSMLTLVINKKRNSGDLCHPHYHIPQLRNNLAIFIARRVSCMLTKGGISLTHVMMIRSSRFPSTRSQPGMYPVGTYPKSMKTCWIAGWNAET